MGCVYRPKDRAVWWIKYRRAGKTYYESSGSERKGDAKTLLARQEGKIAEGAPVTPKVGRVTFEELAADLLNDYRVNGKRSLAVVERRVNKHLAGYFAGARMANVTTANVRAYTAHRQEQGIIAVRGPRKGQRVGDVSNAEINRELALLKRMFNLATQAGKLLHKPHVPLLDESAPRAGFLEPDQQAAILRHLPAHYQPVMRVAAATGWRIDSEVLPLEWRQVDFAGGELRLDAGTTKNGAGRVFPFDKNDELGTVLREQWAEREKLAKAGHITSRVFVRMVAEGRGGEKKPKPLGNFLKAFKRAAVKAGCPGRIPHDMRRTVVRNLSRRGVTDTVAMELTGHKTRSVFDRYNITSGKDLRDAARRLNGQQVIGRAAR